MYTLPVPTRDGLADYDSVVGRRRNSTKAVLSQHRGTVAEAFACYLKFTGNGESLQPIPVEPAVSQALETNFNLLGSNGSHSHIRDEILGSANNHACPYCNVATVDTLDHVLPKTDLPRVLSAGAKSGAIMQQMQSRKEFDVFSFVWAKSDAPLLRKGP